MPIDPNAVGAKTGPQLFTWTDRDTLLYALGVGAGVDDLAFTTENSHDIDQQVLPTYAVIACLPFAAAAKIGTFNFAMLLHGEQDVEIHQPIPVEATVTNSGSVVGVYDKGKAALVVLEVKTTDEAGKPLFTNRFSLFLRGEGGFGGESGPKAGNEAPSRAPDGVITSTTLPQQALIYRLSGDKNPLHADPDFAKMGGFDKPIIHGLCSYGIVCKAIVDKLLGGDVTKVARYQARFAGVGFPGETYLTSYWKEGDKILIQAKSKERDAAIISNAAITIRK